jgi:glycosyltransferase involved in cell wall biosynthesis
MRSSTPIPRRVAHVLRKLDAAAWGGTETHVAAITQRLARLGVSSEVHAPVGPRSDGMPADVRVRRFRAFVPFLGPAERRRALVANAGNLLTLDEVVRLAGDRHLDLAHLHTTGRIGGAVRTAMRGTRRPYVVSVHGPMLAHGDYLARETRERLAGLVDVGRPFGALLGARRVLDDAARVIVFNDDEHAALSARIGARAVRMDHGVDLARFGGGRADRARASFPRLGASRLVLVVGRLSGQKNQVLAVQAFAHGAPPDVHLVLAGAETDRGAREAIVAAALAEGVAARVHVLGNVAPERIADLMAASELVLVPSLHEAFGLAVLEAWAANRPVLFARRAGLLDLARRLRDRSVALEVGDPEAPRRWAEAMGAILRAPERAARAAHEGARVVAPLGWDDVVERLHALYETVLDEAAALRRRAW